MTTIASVIFVVLIVILCILSIIYRFTKNKNIKFQKLKAPIMGLIAISVIFYISLSISNTKYDINNYESNLVVIYTNIFFLIMCFSVYLFYSSFYNSENVTYNNQITDEKILNETYQEIDVKYEDEKYNSQEHIENNKILKYEDRFVHNNVETFEDFSEFNELQDFVDFLIKNKAEKNSKKFRSLIFK